MLIDPKSANYSYSYLCLILPIFISYF
jgi:hypothetical protein